MKSFRSINSHLEFLNKFFKENKETFVTDIFVLESDTYGIRKGGYKTKEILTIARINLSYALSTNYKKSEIIYIPNFEWKRYIYEVSGIDEHKKANIKKEEYFELGKEIVKQKLGVEIENHNVLDSALMFLYFSNKFSKEKQE